METLAAQTLPSTRLPLFETGIDSVFARDVIAGLSAPVKTLPCKYFYDARGSELFEQICQLEEYYVTRTEIGILRDYLPEMSRAVGSRARIIEFGTGDGIKTEMLLSALDSPVDYIPIDISETALRHSAERLRERFPGMAINPLCADYTDKGLFERLAALGPFTVFFPGSTLGNFERAEAVAFLKSLKALIGTKGGILLGIDVMKDPAVLIPAYDDKQGVTAAFNKNLLERINRELGGSFDLEAFEHRAVVNWERSRVEMHLVSLKEQTVVVMGVPFRFGAGETIHTENSHKYAPELFCSLAKMAGLGMEQSWQDARGYFTMHYLVISS